MICPLYEVISPPPRTHLDTHTRDKRTGSQSLLFPWSHVHETWVKEGHTILLPGNVPHSPCRFENTIGLVIEKIRTKDQIDALRWYCKECKKIVYEVSFNCIDIQSQLKEVINKYAGSEELRTCANCKYLNPPF